MTGPTEVAAGRGSGRPFANVSVLAAVGCYTLWGFLPILFIRAGSAGAGAFEIVAWRTIWSLPCAMLLVLVNRKLSGVRRLGRAGWIALTCSSVLIAANWTTYVWAVEAGHTISASLGYYILPLLNVAAGAALFKERISRSEQLAVALAAIGVVLQGVALGAFPWVSIVLALSFCGYGVVRKRAQVEAEVGLLVECLILFTPAALYALWIGAGGHAAFGSKLEVTTLLVLCGPATVIPLALFAFSVGKLPLSLMGFLQFISPTLQFAVGVESGEKLTPLRILSFAFIWAGVLTFAARLWWEKRGARAALA